MASESETELYIPCKKTRAVLGPNDFIMLDRGANLMAPSSDSVSRDKGRRILLDGGRDSQAAAVFAILLRLSPSAHYDSVADVASKCWKYFSPAGTLEGPFAARSLRAWLAKGQLKRSFPVLHEPSRVWLPLWLLDRHCELLLGNEAEPAKPYAPMPWPFSLLPDCDVVMTDVELVEEVRMLRHEKDFMEALAHMVAMDIDDPGSGWEAVAAQRPELLANLPGLCDRDSMLHLPAPMEIEVEVEAEAVSAPDVGSEAWQQAAEASAALQALPMQLPQVVPPVATADLAQAAAAVAALGPRPRLYLVVDTNVLLLPEGMSLLGEIRRRFAPGASGRVPAGAPAEAVSCVAVVPWTVLAELDGLKAGGTQRGSRGRGSGSGEAQGYESPSDERPVAAMARSALSLLRSALDTGDSFYTGQTLRQFREACAHPATAIPMGASGISNDDRILQCCLQLQAELPSKVAATGRRHHVVLLSNDNALCVKARLCGIPAASTRRLQGPTAAPVGLQANGHQPHSDQLESALLHLAETGGAAAGESAQGTGAGAGAAGGSSAASTPAAVAGGVSSAAALSPSSPAQPASWSPLELGTSRGPGAAGAADNDSGPFIVRTSDRGDGSGNGNVNGVFAAGGQGRLVGDFDLDELADPLVSALHAELRRLTVGLAPLIWNILLSDFGDTVPFVVERQPPWGGADLLEVFHRHWRSTFADKMPRDQERECAGLVDRMLKDVRYFERGRGRPRREPRLLQVAEDFSKGVDTLLQSFGVHPPPAPPLPVALLALRDGPAGPPGGGRNRSASAQVSPFTGPARRANMQGPRGDAAQAAAEVPGASGPAALLLRDAQQQQRQLAPAALRAAAIAQSIGLGVNLAGPAARGQGQGHGAAAMQAAAGPAAAVASSARHAQHPVQQQAAASPAAALLAAAAPGGSGAGSNVGDAQQGALAAMALQLREALRAGGRLDPQVAQLLQQVALLQQHQQQQQEDQRRLHHQHSAHVQSSATNGGQALPLRAVSESGRPGSAAGTAAAAAAAQLQQHQQHQLQLLQQQQKQQQQAQQILHRIHSDPPSGGEGAVAQGHAPVTLASLAASLSNDPRVQAEAAARQLQQLQLQHQQQQQAAAMHALAQQAAVGAEGQAHSQHMSRAQSGEDAAGAAAPSPLSPVGSGGGAGVQSAAWHALLAETHHRQQQMHHQHHHQHHQQQHQQQQQQPEAGRVPNPLQLQHLQVMLQQHEQAAAAAAAVGGATSPEAMAAAAAAAAAMKAGLPPEMIAALQQAQQAQQQLALLHQQAILHQQAQQQQQQAQQDHPMM